MLVAIHFQSTIFTAAKAINFPEYLVLLEPLQTISCTTSTPGPHRGKPKPSRAASGANPSGGPTCTGGNETTIKTQGQCG